MESSQLVGKNFKIRSILQWGKLIIFTGSAQLFVQGAGLISGIIIIRLLPTREYAFYTLVNTMLGTMTVLSDGGISAGVMAQGGQVWKDADKLGAVMVTGFDLRKKFAVFSLLISVPILLYLLISHGATWSKAAIIVLTLVPAFIAALSDSLLEIGPKLWQDVKRLQINQAFVGVFRLLMVGSVYLFPWAAIAIIASGIPRIIGNIKLRKISSKYVNWDQQPDPVIKREILSVVKRILPGSVYYCISGQITVWLISLFGNTTSLAQVGALGRLSLFLTLISTLFNTIIIPRFSRLPNVKSVLLSRFFLILIFVIASLILIVVIVYFFPRFFLSILGNGYSNLSSELPLSVIGSCLGVLAGILYSLTICKGWVINPILSISVNVASIIIGSITMKISTLHGVLGFNILTSVVPALLMLFYLYFRIVKEGIS